MENKITDEQLETIKEHQNKTNSILNQVGYLESQKHGLLHELAGVNQDIEEFKNSLEKEYGAINIDIETGTYTKIEEEEEVAVSHV
tara:strand:- start:17874 stop:18131 length:258 start_codon:yes stop_codon:yes gene_type:complete